MIRMDILESFCELGTRLMSSVDKVFKVSVGHSGSTNLNTIQNLCHSDQLTNKTSCGFGGF